MYYKSWTMPEVTGKAGGLVIAYAESRDGLTFTKPELGLHEVNGSKQNNVIWTGVGTHNFAPFLDARADCPKESRFKALGGAYAVTTSPLHPEWGVVVSAAGAGVALVGVALALVPVSRP